MHKENLNNVQHDAMVQRKHTEEERNVTYFDSIAEEYSSLYRQKTSVGVAFRLRRQRVLELFDKPGGKVLDVGCGPGVLVKDLLVQNCTYWGIDRSPNMIEQCRKNFASRPDVHFSVGVGEQIEFRDQSFDAVICVGVFDRIKDSEMILLEMLRVLKSGGTLLLSLSNKNSPYFLWRDFVFCPAVSVVRPFYYWLSAKPRRPVGPGHRLYSVASFADTVARHRCPVTDIVYSGFNFFLPPLDSAFPRVAAIAMEKLEALRHGVFQRFGGMAILKATKQ